MKIKMTMQESLKSHQLSLLINHAGAEVCSVKNNTGTEYIWQARAGTWPRHAPVLFPVVGKLKDNRFRYLGKTYELGQHGFARDMLFSVIEKTPSSCTFELRANEKTRPNFPFDFVFRIHYLLHGNALTTRFEVGNPSGEILYFSVGAHPGFNCPLNEEENFEDYYIEFEHDSFIQTSLHEGLRSDNRKVMPLSGEKLFLSDTLFNDDALVFENHQINSVTLASVKTGSRVKLICDNWPYFGIWSKKGCREFVCLEPWFGIADHKNTGSDLTLKDGIIALEPGKEFACSYSLTFT
jgi:galactose mutarotase-like enzyme